MRLLSIENNRPFVVISNLISNFLTQQTAETKKLF